MESEVKEVGILVVTHGDFGKALISGAEFIMGEQSNVISYGIDAGTSLDDGLALLKKNVSDVDCGAGVLVLTDMFGGTPTNLSLSLMQNENIEVLTGVSLPMLLKALQSRALPLEELALLVKDAGVNGIVVAGEMLKTR